MKIYILLSALIFGTTSLLSMEKKVSFQEEGVVKITAKDDIDWAQCKALYFDQYRETALGTEEHWERIKMAIQKDEINCEYEVGKGFESYFIAFKGPFEFEEKKTAFFYPSAGISGGGAIWSKVDQVYTVDLASAPYLVIIGFEKIEDVPEGLEEPKEYIFPDWENKKLFASYVLDVKKAKLQRKLNMPITAADHVIVENVTTRQLASALEPSSYCSIN